ncbi:MAG: EamA family transporter, partial [Pseudomonadota bacterium]
MTTSQDQVWRAIGISLIALLCFDIMGLVIKHLSPRYAASELSAYRNLLGLIPSALVLALSRDWHAGGRKLLIRQWPLALLRGAMVTLAQLSFYLALGKIAFATATTISYSNALFITAISVPLLGEKVGWIRWSAVLIG